MAAASLGNYRGMRTRGARLNARWLLAIGAALLVLVVVLGLAVDGPSLRLLIPLGAAGAAVLQLAIIRPNRK